MGETWWGITTTAAGYDDQDTLWAQVYWNIGQVDFKIKSGGDHDQVDFKLKPGGDDDGAVQGRKVTDGRGLLSVSANLLHIQTSAPTVQQAKNDQGFSPA